MRRYAATVLGLVAASSFVIALPASGQVDVLARAFQHCTDQSRPVDRRIAACSSILEAQGIEPVEKAFGYLDLGSIYDARGEEKAASEQYAKAISLVPDLWEARANLARIYLRRGDMDAALAEYNTMNKIDPAEAKKYRMSFGWRYRPQTGSAVEGGAPRDPEAVHADDFEKFKQELADDLAYRCNMRLVERVFDSALSDCNQAIALAPKSAQALGQRGLIEFQLGQFKPALDDFTASIDIAGQKSVGGYFMRGVVKHRLGDVKGGDEDIRAAVALEPDITARYAKLGITP